MIGFVFYVAIGDGPAGLPACYLTINPFYCDSTQRCMQGMGVVYTSRVYTLTPHILLMCTCIHVRSNRVYIRSFRVIGVRVHNYKGIYTWYKGMGLT